MIEKTINFLREYSHSSEYVFHGSKTCIDILEPRQAHNNGEKDGKPAIFASSEIYIPMFMSVFDPVPGIEKISCGVDDDFNTHLGATKNILQRVPEHEEGYVYVLDKQDFTNHDHHEWVSYKNTKPLYVVKITRKDIDIPITEIK